MIPSSPVHRKNKPLLHHPRPPPATNISSSICPPPALPPQYCLLPPSGDRRPLTRLAAVGAHLRALQPLGHDGGGAEQSGMRRTGEGGDALALPQVPGHTKQARAGKTLSGATHSPGQATHTHTRLLLPPTQRHAPFHPAHVPADTRLARARCHLLRSGGVSGAGRPVCVMTGKGGCLLCVWRGDLSAMAAFLHATTLPFIFTLTTWFCVSGRMLLPLVCVQSWK